ncbi:toll/interleukin-1 receptor domain-containing protein [Mesorhizobium sp. B2-1-8]|uniref:toll/interleukin-1 receptor domain-containing protein n=1 Tax=Mesorhizobium sp. B2-1-8 TaxID=2589967 RepID=UPI00112C856F|nr:toll/interleukin-1 receptor domain-containing protein [Mesorhizobium sp. B2-1-8]UCI21349.1 toll/interleukin-1 receptor domain-containing protein [Mesorhizobium sp. B2-1-8]
MALYTEDFFRTLGRPKAISKTASVELAEEIAATNNVNSFDVFLSHSIKDKQVILGVKRFLERQDLVVYVDWIVDNDLERTKVNSDTAEKLRVRMRQSKSLLYAHSNNSPGSKWMPWELGFFDGSNGHIAILPIGKSADESFTGQEFVGLYPSLENLSAASLFLYRGSAPERYLAHPPNPTVTSVREFKSWLKASIG